MKQNPAERRDSLMEAQRELNRETAGILKDCHKAIAEMRNARSELARFMAAELAELFDPAALRKEVRKLVVAQINPLFKEVETKILTVHALLVMRYPEFAQLEENQEKELSCKDGDTVIATGIPVKGDLSEEVKKRLESELKRVECAKHPCNSCGVTLWVIPRLLADLESYRQAGANVEILCEPCGERKRGEGSNDWHLINYEELS